MTLPESDRTPAMVTFKSPAQAGKPRTSSNSEAASVRIARLRAGRSALATEKTTSGGTKSFLSALQASKRSRLKSWGSPTHERPAPPFVLGRERH